MTDQQRLDVKTLLYRRLKLGESERTAVALFVLDIVDDAEDFRDLLNDCDCLAEAALALKAKFQEEFAACL